MSDSNAQSTGTRDKILIAAATMLGENPSARLSVRAVAERAGVSTGSLRHFFPTQRELVDTVVAGMYEVNLPDDPIRDRTLPPVERLLACLQTILAAVGTGETARESWRSTHDRYIAEAPSADAAATYEALERLGRRRIERWLDTLAAEGAIAEGDDEADARFLSTVLNGIYIERVLPITTNAHAAHTTTLRTAARTVVRR